MNRQVIRNPLPCLPFILSMACRYAINNSLRYRAKGQAHPEGRSPLPSRTARLVVGCCFLYRATTTSQTALWAALCGDSFRITTLPISDLNEKERLIRQKSHHKSCARQVKQGKQVQPKQLFRYPKQPQSYLRKILNDLFLPFATKANEYHRPI